METTGKNISRISSALLLMTTVLLGISIFVPIWRIDLDAPQYPEGLKLLIYANKLAGNVDIINGLNHYIGMKTLHTEDFFEFRILSYLIGGFAFLAVLAVFVGRKWFLNALLIAFILFGVIAMVDFWKWEYNYGHNLDPNAAIIVPGMAYQPPLIGFKQLLNFGAYSVPALGGWLFVVSGVLMVIAFLIETKLFKSKKMRARLFLPLLASVVLFSCGETKPQQAKLNVDNCDHCKMTIADAKFVAEIITPKGRVYKFDDLACMQSYRKENSDKENLKLYVANFEKPEQFMPVVEAVFVRGEQINSPMGGNTAAFDNKTSAEDFSDDRDVQIVMWSDIRNQ